MIILKDTGIDVIERFLRTLDRLSLADYMHFRQSTPIGVVRTGRYIIDSDDEINFYSEFE